MKTSLKIIFRFQCWDDVYIFNVILWVRLYLDFFQFLHSLSPTRSYFLVHLIIMNLIKRSDNNGNSNVCYFTVEWWWWRRWCCGRGWNYVIWNASVKLYLTKQTWHIQVHIYRKNVYKPIENDSTRFTNTLNLSHWRYVCACVCQFTCWYQKQDAIECCNQPFRDALSHFEYSRESILA